MEILRNIVSGTLKNNKNLDDLYCHIRVNRLCSVHIFSVLNLTCVKKAEVIRRVFVESQFHVVSYLAKV